MAKQTKRCPECLSDVPSAARRCAHCRHRFRSTSDQIILAVLTIVVLAIAVTWFVNSQLQNSEAQGKHDGECIIASVQSRYRPDC